MNAAKQSDAARKPREACVDDQLRPAANARSVLNGIRSGLNRPSDRPRLSAKVLIGRPERGNYGTFEQFLIASLEIQALLELAPIPHREAVLDTTISFSHQHQLHTLIGGRWQADRHALATGGGKHGSRLKARLTVRSYCVKEARKGWGFVEIPHKP
jgi:hypothetical protein